MSRVILDEPLNASERYLHGINVRLEILIEMFSSFLDAYANQNEIATEQSTVIEEVQIEEEMDYSVLTKSEIMNNLDIMGIEYKPTMLKKELIELLKVGE